VVDGGGGQVEQRLTSSGFDLSGLDFHTGGTLEKNISFYVLPSSDNTGAFHFETVMARLDNVFNSTWLNVKLGKFELDNLLSEKRILTLTANGGIYQLYHFIPAGDGNIFGQIGSNQLGVEVMGHSYNDRTRYSAALLSSNNGTTGFVYGSQAYSGFFAASQAFDAGKLGVQRLGFYAMVGEAPTSYLTNLGAPIGGSGTGNKGFSREGFVGQFYFGQRFDVQVVTQHGSDSAWFGQGYGDLIDGVAVNNNTPGTTLPAGSPNAGIRSLHSLRSIRGHQERDRRLNTFRSDKAAHQLALPLASRRHVRGIGCVFDSPRCDRRGRTGWLEHLRETAGRQQLYPNFLIGIDRRPASYR